MTPLSKTQSDKLNALKVEAENKLNDILNEFIRATGARVSLCNEEEKVMLHKLPVRLFVVINVDDLKKL